MPLGIPSHAPSPSRSPSPIAGPSSVPRTPSSVASHDSWNMFHKNYFQEQRIWRREVEVRKADETLCYHNAGGNELLDFDTDGNLRSYLWYRLTSSNPVVPPQAGPSGLQPRRSGRTTWPVVHPKNLYGNQAPVDTKQMTDTEFQRLTSGVPASSGSQSRSQSPQNTGKGKQKANYLARFEQEGGAGLINFLLSAAIKPTDRVGGKLPDVHSVREWHYGDLMRFPEAAWKEWKAACLQELESLQKQSIFKLTDLPKGCKTIGCRWVFDIKSDSQKKARLVAQGFSQVEGIDFNKLFSPVVQFESVRLVFALAALNRWYMTRVDVRMAYLYGKLDEEIYMCQPEGFVATGQESKVICLQQALYSLKQAGLAWWKELSQSMKALGFTCLNSDARIYVCGKGTNIILAVVYVDDAMFLSKNKNLVDKKKALFMGKWECRDLGDVKEFLHMHVKRHGLDIHINQVNYLKKVLECFQMTNAKMVQTPLPSNWDLKVNKRKALAAEITRYQSIIGSLLYLMIGTRPDIAFAVTHLSQFSTNPTEDHYNAALHICRYLAGTQDYTLVYSHTTGKGLCAYMDSNWAANKIRH
jgi:Reverse transcriptase (RNA-dependent DNA polymerase)